MPITLTKLWPPGFLSPLLFACVVAFCLLLKTLEGFQLQQQQEQEQLPPLRR